LFAVRPCDFSDQYHYLYTEIIMFAALSKAFAQLPEQTLRNSVILSVLGALAMILASGFMSGWLVSQIQGFGIEWLDSLLGALGGGLVMVLSFMFYPATVMVVAGFFFDRVASAVEDRHYRELPEARHKGLGEIFKSAFVLLAITLVLNILMLPIYLLTFFVGGLGFVIFYCLNGYLLGREFFEIAASRHMDPKEARALRRSQRWTVFGAGVIIAVMTTIPILNLAVPVIATAFMVNIFQLLHRRTKA
jgi:CysZ protein